ncbi:hypothetical protein AOLI_G00270170 [Acnodon oligacanthus]
MASEAGVETLSLRHGVRCVPESGVTVEEVLLAVAEQVGCENIYSASRMNRAVVVFLVTESCVSRLTESGIWVKGNMVQVSPLSAPATRVIVSNVPPFIKNEVLLKELARFGKFASDMKMIPLGCKKSAVRHVLSFRRQVFMFLNNRHQSLEVSFRCKHGDGSYIVFTSSERLRCFQCGDIVHKQFGCPHKAAQQVHLDTDQANTQGGRQGVSGLTAESNASAAGSEGHDQHTELVPSGAAEASTSSGRKAKAKTDSPVREEDEQVIEHLGVIDSSAHEERVGELEGEKVRTALREEFQSTEDSPETSRDLTENLQDQIEAEAEAEAIKLLDEEEADNNQPLGDEMLEMMAIKGEAQVIKDVVLTDLQDLRTENLRDINFADTEAEAIKPQVQIDGDDPGTPNHQPLDAETDWMIDYEPIKKSFSTMSDQELYRVVSSIKAERPHVGYSFPNIMSDGDEIHLLKVTPSLTVQLDSEEGPIIDEPQAGLSRSNEESCFRFIPTGFNDIQWFTVR